MKEWLEDILLQILLERKLWMQDIGDQLYSRILMTFAKVMIVVKNLEDSTKSLAKLVITLLEEPFMKWGLNFIGQIKPTR
jgi:hypothetical protein